ncbi:MAG: HAD family hydrolase [Clostridia bacterium]|nr:HAD family hydrolase [Clostridia bacterium]
MSKAIVFDLDETLRSLDTSLCEGVNVILRPKLTELLNKLEEEKQNGVDSIIFSSSSMKSIKNNFLDKLPENYRDVFTKIISRENYLEPKQGTRENYLYKLGANKIVTALDYDDILFFDDNMGEYQFLKELYDVDLDCKFPIPNKSVTLVRLPFYPRGEAEMYALKETAKNLEKKGKSDFSNNIKKYFGLMAEEPGCRIMTEMIDEFVSKNHNNCFTYVNGTEEFNEYNEQLRKYNRYIENTLDNNTTICDLYRDYEDEYYDKLEAIDVNELF